MAENHFSLTIVDRVKINVSDSTGFITSSQDRYHY